MTSSFRIPISPAFRAACSAAICAAYGVDLREPLNPTEPPDVQPATLPSWSVSVKIVLLNVALIWTWPWVIVRFPRRLRDTGAPVQVQVQVPPAPPEEQAPEPLLQQVRQQGRLSRGQQSRELCLMWSLLRDLLLACDRNALALAGTGVRMCPLTANGKTSTVPEALVAADLDLPLDVLGDISAKIALDLVVAVDELADAENLSIRQVTNLGVERPTPKT